MNRKRALVAKAPKDYKLLWMAMPFIVIVFLFSYVPIFGWIYSFFDYVPGVSIFDCDFVGLDYFKLIFNDDNVLRSLKNTFIFALINICLTPLPMFMAILLNELRNGPIKKFTQTFTTLPNFISWVIIFSLATALFASDGIVTGLATALGIGDASNSLLGSNEAVYAVVGSVGNGATLRLFSDIKNVKYTEGRFLPYFFPDTFHEGGDPVKEAKVNWVTARRAILRSPIQRIGYGGYLKLALEFPEFVQYIQEVCDEFRTLYDNIQGTTPYCVKRVAVLNCWGKMRSWGNHMVHHAIYYKQNYSYFGIIEALSGAPFDVSFISFDDIRENRELLKNFDVIINVGDADTAQTGGENWIDETISTAIREFVYNGGGFIGVGEPAAHQWQGKFFQLDDILGVEEERGFNLNTDKYNWEEHRDHFILQDTEGDVDFGEGKKNIFALPETEILIHKNQEVQMAVKTFGKGRGVYISGLPYSFENSRVLYRAVLWSASAEKELYCWYSSNYNVEVHAYVKNKKYCVVNNTYEPQDTTVYIGDGSSFELHMEPNEIKWYQIQ